MFELDRAKVVTENFVTRVREGEFPAPRSQTTMEQAGLAAETYLDLFDAQLKSRHLDLISRQLKQQGLSYYTIGSSGHEGNAVLGAVFKPTDMAFLHYRSAAFMLQRAKCKSEINMAYDILLSLMASSSDPISAGKHKVFGSFALNVPPQTSTIASHLPKAVGAALSITRAKELKIDANLAEDSVILCSFGDASLNHSVAQGALNSVQWITRANYPLPLIFICEDNGIGISVSTPSDWVESNIANRIGIHYLSCDGLNLADVWLTAQKAEQIARIKKEPVFLHIKTVRLLGHAGSDIESQYLSAAEIEANELNDPLLHTAQVLLQKNILSREELIACYKKTEKNIALLAQQAMQEPRLNSAKAIMRDIIPHTRYSVPPLPADNNSNKSNDKKNLSQLLNLALSDLLLQYKNALVFGEDVAKKGGVYRVTAGLMKQFGQRRVFDTLLDETTILGNAIGLAMNGFLPVPEIQFLAYYHNAQDQIRGEAATLSFFSNSQYSNPMVIRIASFGYQKGFGGHFHNDNAIAVLRDIPGLIIACPSNGADAVKMLRKCFELAQGQRRIIAFLEPIALYMTKDLHEGGDNLWLSAYAAPAVEQKIELGEVGLYGKNSEFVIISYANGYYLSRQAAHILKNRYHIDVKVIDLRWLSPLPKESLKRAIGKANQVLIVDECRKTASISEEIITWMVESYETLPKIQRLTGEDSFIPLGTAWQYVLPSKNDIVEKVRAMMDKNKKTGE